jgi:S-DNA-T family DNA segregation ATPase FtsK/SpoIIIE
MSADAELTAMPVAPEAIEAGESATAAKDSPPARPVYADLSEGRAQRKPVIPAHWRTREAARQHVALAAARHAHGAAYHGVRAPRYVLLVAWWALVGVMRTLALLLAWWHVPGIASLERQAAADGLIHDHLRLHKAGKDTRTARGIILGAGAVVVAAALVILSRAPVWAQVLLALAALPLLARAGRPAHRPIVQPAVLPAAIQAPDQDVITRAIGSLGIARIDRWLRDGRALVFPSPVREDGPGWRAEVDLPYGLTAAMVTERREQLASGLRRPLGAVWPEPVTHEHAGRLELWVGRQDVAKAKQGPWPLARGGQADVFTPVPFGTDVRGRTVNVPVAYHNWLIGAIPRQGKTAAVRGLACAVALDPVAEMQVHELKGSGDLDPLERVSHRFVSGVDDESIGYAAESLRLLRAEIMRRTERLKALDRTCARTSAPPGRSPPSAACGCGPSSASSTRRKTCSPTPGTARPPEPTPSFASRSARRSASCSSSPPSAPTSSHCPPGYPGTSPPGSASRSPARSKTT